MIHSFDIPGDRDLTEDELDLAFNIQMVYEGYIIPEHGGGRPAMFHCDIPADSLETAIRDAAVVIRRLGLVPGSAIVPVPEPVG